jgi:hypothetical protein
MSRRCGPVEPADGDLQERVPTVDGPRSAGLEGDDGQFEQLRRAGAAGAGVVDGVVHNGAGDGVGGEGERDVDLAADRQVVGDGQVGERDWGVVVVAERRNASGFYDARPAQRRGVTAARATFPGSAVHVEAVRTGRLPIALAGGSC